MEKNSLLSIYSDLKVSVVELKLNCTLKNMIWKKFSANGSYRCIGLVDDFVDTYNNNIHER